MRLYKIPDIVLSIRGNAAAFLNGIASNTLDARHNAFLTQHGRIIATFRQQKISDDEFLIGVPPVAVDNLLKHLERYAKLSRVQIVRGVQNIFINLDTRDILWTTDVHANSITEEQFTLFRLNNNIPLMGIDYQADEFILNVQEHDYVSYTKGCFLGQEPVAKVHNRSQPSRKLIAVFEDECPVPDRTKMTSKAVDLNSGRSKGFVFVDNKAV